MQHPTLSAPDTMLVHKVSTDELTHQCHQPTVHHSALLVLSSHGIWTNAWWRISTSQCHAKHIYYPKKTNGCSLTLYFSLLPSPGNHGFLFSNSFALFWMSCSWNHTVLGFFHSASSFPFYSCNKHHDQSNLEWKNLFQLTVHCKEAETWRQALKWRYGREAYGLALHGLFSMACFGYFLMLATKDHIALRWPHP